MENKLTLQEYNSFSEGFIFKYENEWVEPTYKTLPNGIVLAASPDNIEDLENMLQEFEKECSVALNSDAVKIIAMGEMPYGAPGGFCPKTKAIKIHPISSLKDREYEQELIFLHEYAHAMDFHLDLQKEFRKEYIEMIEEVGYAYHESEEHSWKVGVEPQLTGNMMNDMQNFFRDQNAHLKITNMGYCGLRCAMNIREFVAMTFMHWFKHANSYHPTFKTKVDKILGKHFLKPKTTTAL